MKLDLSLNNQQRLMCDKTQTTTHATEFHRTCALIVEVVSVLSLGYSNTTQPHIRNFLKKLSSDIHVLMMILMVMMNDIR